ncbi:M20 family metallopeptidase [Actinosynnema sp. NPDC047251]|uniref:Amidohydrolase family protein n=1 Tax=Saccharothrix espanaensis (strain ATCC 51144 / DSM 44229 / JCM 9112 / NBRC 15066 / NRRL 15764) TaxID=1179773 RepID=K3W498_SACES|nr:M20 family metallopeptidase [Saccharothrix espanaensis]CCH27557.1 Amidohydrolase family protein [Saccharothrix espanaensis DSM 44229]
MSTTLPNAQTSAPEPRFTGLVEAARALQPRTVALRRQIHRHPEQGLALPATQAAIQHSLAGLPLEITTGKSSTSLVAVLRGAKPGPTVLLRGDMDALPLQEETGLEYASETAGSMHACGHDTHVAMLASSARLLSTRREALSGQVVFMFQPGEEGMHGAKHMLDEGVLDAAGTPVEKAFALHITSTLQSGVVVSRPGPTMASADTFHVTITGRGGHGAMPHDAVDPIPPAAALVGALQTMVARRVNVHQPAVVSVTNIKAGTTTNIIPETALVEGTIRTLSEDTRALVHKELPQVCEHVAAAHGCTARVQIIPGYPVTVNDAEVGPHVLDVTATALGNRWAAPMDDPLMGAEDFSYVLQRVPGAISFLGACPRGVELDRAEPNHSNRVLFDESAMEHGVVVYTAFALDALR